MNISEEIIRRLMAIYFFGPF